MVYNLKAEFGRRYVQVCIMHEQDLYSMPNVAAEELCGPADFVFIIKPDGTNVLKNQLAKTREAAETWYWKYVYPRIAKSEEGLRIEGRGW